MVYDRTDIARGFVSRLDLVGSKKAIKELASLLIEYRLHGQIEEILLDISKEYSKKHGIVEAEVRSMFPLTDSIKQELSQLVKSSTKAKKVIINEKIDKSLLGGLIITAPDMDLDLSLKTKLARLRV